MSRQYLNVSHHVDPKPGKDSSSHFSKSSLGKPFFSQAMAVSQIATGPVIYLAFT